MGRLAYLVGDIVSSPRYFFNNLVSGIGQGFSTFVQKIDEYLATAFFDWLRGSSGLAIQMPRDWEPKGIFNLFAQLLNLSTETIWERMEIVYDKTVANAFRRGEVLLDKGLEIFGIVKNEGLSGLWDEIKSSLGNILDETLKMIKENVLYAAIKKAIGEIGKMLVPGGGFIAIAEKIFRLLQFIVEARNKILDLIKSFVDSVEMAVKGNVPGIVERITGALTRFITVALDFLVSFFGLGSLKEKVTGFIERMRKPVIRGIDWVLGKLKPVVMKGKKVFEKGKEKVIGAGKAVVQVGVPQDPNERLRLAARASVAAARRLTGRITEGLLNPILAGIKIRYGLTAIQPYKKNGTWWVRATINPEVDQNLDVPVEVSSGEQVEAGPRREGEADTRTDADKARDVHSAVGEAEALLSRPLQRGVSFRGRLNQIKERYRLTTLELRPAQRFAFEVYAEINPFEIRQLGAQAVERLLNDLHVRMRQTEAYLRNKNAEEFREDKREMSVLWEEFSTLTAVLQSTTGFIFLDAVAQLLSVEGRFSELDERCRNRPYEVTIPHPSRPQEFRIRITAVTNKEEAMKQAQDYADQLGNQIAADLRRGEAGQAGEASGEAGTPEYRARRQMVELANRLALNHPMAEVLRDAFKWKAARLEEEGKGKSHVTQV